MSRLLALGGLVLSLACGADSPPDVLLVTLDTTRADHLGCYGSTESTTPNIDAFAGEAVLFEQAFATNPITLPSHASILTGTYPLHHGVRNNTTYVLDDGVTTLAEILSAQGYATSACIGAFVLDAQFNLDQGFDVYDDRIEEGWARDELERRARNAFGFAERKANMVTRAALDRLQTVGRGPFFLWVHYFDPHEPMDPPEPHHSRFADPYDGEIAFVDEQVGVLLNTLREMRRYDNTIVVVVADHGEGRMDHGEPTHSLLIFDSTMQVPLLVKPPGSIAGVRVKDLASTVDVVPTVLDLLDLPIPSEVQGLSLVPSFSEPSVPADRGVYMESLMARLSCGWGELRGFRTADEKLIFGPVPRYYRVAEDPGEIYDLARRNPAAVERLELRLAEALTLWERPEADRSVSLIDAETAERLAAMGYLVGSVTASLELDETLEGIEGRVDPHEKNPLFDLFSSGLEDIRQERYLEGIRRLEGVVEADPGFKDALKSLAIAYMLHARQPDRARELFERALVIDPYQEDAQYFLGKIFLESGDLTRARTHFEAILDFRPMTAPAVFALGAIHSREGDQEQARDLFEAALDISPRHHQSLIALGAYHARRKEHETAGEYYRRAREVAPAHPETLYNTAIWYLQGGDTAQAISFLEQTVEVQPADPDAHFVLATLLIDDGRTEEARRALMAARRHATDPARIAEIELLLGSLEAE